MIKIRLGGYWELNQFANSTIVYSTESVIVLYNVQRKFNYLPNQSY